MLIMEDVAYLCLFQCSFAEVYTFAVFIVENYAPTPVACS